VTQVSESTRSSTWLDVVTVLTCLGLIAFEVVARTGRTSVLLALTGLILSLATRRVDRRRDRVEREARDAEGE
jgi:hypothetical protein